MASNHFVVRLRRDLFMGDTKKVKGPNQIEADPKYFVPNRSGSKVLCSHGFVNSLYWTLLDVTCFLYWL